jgi:PPOX class probable F420-dependent enzyme
MAGLQNPKVQKILRSKAFAHLATIGPDGAPQSSPTWFLWDGERIMFTHTTTRQKYRNIQRDPRVAVSITDVEAPYAYAELRGRVERIEPDPTGAFYRYPGQTLWGYQGDPRMILYVKIEYVASQNLS